MRITLLPRSARPLWPMAGAARRVHAVTKYSALLNTILALLAVVAVMAVHGLLRLLLMPFRILRGLFRHSSRNARVTAG